MIEVRCDTCDSVVWRGSGSVDLAKPHVVCADCVRGKSSKKLHGADASLAVAVRRTMEALDRIVKNVEVNDYTVVVENDETRGGLVAVARRGNRVGLYGRSASSETEALGALVDHLVNHVRALAVERDRTAEAAGREAKALESLAASLAFVRRVTLETTS